jgi:hypothetical protein
MNRRVAAAINRNKRRIGMTLSAWVIGFGTLALVLAVKSRLGHRAAGLAASLPLTSGPLALAAWMASGPEIARAVIAGSIDAVGAAAVSVTAFSVLRRFPLWVSVPGAVLAFFIVVTLKSVFTLSLLEAALLATVLVGACAAFSRYALIESELPKAKTKANSRASICAPFLLLAVAFICFPLLPPDWSGVLASAPTLALSVLISQRLANPDAHGVALIVQGGYEGMAVKVVFFVLFLAALDFEAHAWMAFAFAALVCFGVGFVLWLRNRRATPLAVR